MQDGAVADVAMTKNQLEQNFNQLLYPFEPFVVDKDHRMELNDYMVNVTARGPPKFHGAYGSFYVIHPLKMEVFNTKEMEVAVWTLTDAYCLSADIFITHNKLKLSLTLDSGFLDMEGDNRARLHGGAYDAVEMLEKVLNQESPFPMLDYLQQELPLPLVPDIGEVMKMEDTSYDEFLLVSIITK
ncbi:Hypothetical predicted protein [Podarcis lilfordi]|uniref:Uncharacterized protein n=1 Tax=Podarcis lilfordi TaxID=74358 RepID=A0AA35KJC1_9SAUR|nr:Hypothetical predicted protein [Podarcis lilfordi]